LQEWINQTLDSGAVGFAVPLAAFLLGLLSSITCACCTFPLLGAVAGYSGTTETRSRRATLSTAMMFMLGVIAATVILGAIAGLVGDLARMALGGRYWKLIAGFIIIFFGLAVMKVLPFELPKRKKKITDAEPKGFLSAALFGFLVGGAIGFCSLPCNPGIFVVLGFTVAYGYTLWTFVMLVSYGIGFSLPLAAIMLSVSLGKSMFVSNKTKKLFRTVAGVLLIIAGFYLLSTL
jgi:cytochrome c biogenesis protein CcdA